MIFDLENYFLLSFVKEFKKKNDAICLAVEINERCSDSKQCQELNPHSICNLESNKCECQQGFIHQNDSCLPGVYELFIPLIVKYMCLFQTY